MISSVKPSNMKILSQLLLVVWLCSLIAHSNHALVNEQSVGSNQSVISIDTDTLYQFDTDQQCHLCHNTIDKFDDIELKTFCSLRSTRIAFSRIKRSEAYSVSYFLPLLRGPPNTINTIHS